MQQVATPRRHDIDWLRTLTFLLLIFYHVGMYYVADWDFHVKSTRQLAWLQDPMILSNQWRMSLLFFISGIALALVHAKYPLTVLLRLRSSRLLVPLLFSMLVIVPPQLYFELQQKFGYAGTYLAFMHEYLDPGTTLAPQKQSPLGLLTWNHLWFLPYLWCYSVLVLCSAPLWKWLAVRLEAVPGLALFMLLVAALTALRLLLRTRFPSTHALLDDWFNHSQYLLVFCAGYLLPALPRCWEALIARRRSFLVLALLCYGWIVLDRHGLLRIGDERFNTLWWIDVLHQFLYSLNHWCWIFAVLGYAGGYLRFSNRLLHYANEAVLPWYILHQTLIILFAVWLARAQLPLPLEAALLLSATLTGCLLGSEAARRNRVLRYLFGMKRQGATDLRDASRPTLNAARQ